MKTKFRLAVADSFRVRERNFVAEARGFQLHLQRFQAAVTQLSLTDGPTLDAFVDEATVQMAGAGSGFPRIECWSDGTETRLHVSIRPCPPLTSELTMASVTGVELESPEIKGPNISRLIQLTRELQAEPLLVAADGTVIEGATTSLLVWRHGTPHVIDTSLRVASVTEHLMIALLERDDQARVRVERGHFTVEELVECEVWSLNALHGIRPVTRIDGAALPAPQLERLRRSRDLLESTWEPLREVTTSLRSKA